jgi:hypothetical protein
VDWLEEQPGLDKDRIVLIGASRESRSGESGESGESTLYT